jgi:UDP-glucose 4-epimerase
MPSWLVTGGCGFIGSHLVEALLGRGDRVRVLDDLSSGRRENLREGAELVVADVAASGVAFQAADGMDGIFHLAAVASVQRCREDWLGSHRSNLTGTIAVFDAARRAKTPLPVVYASSAAVYGDSDALPLRETARARPLSAYGVDKLGCELHGEVAWSVYGVGNSGLRFFNVYGPRQDPASPYSGVIAIFAGRIANRVPIDIFGDGQQTRDFIFVGDVVTHLLAAMEKLRAGAAIFNVCTGRSTSILELAQTMARILGEEVRIRHLAKRVGDIEASIGDPSDARRSLGVSATVSVAEGLRRTLAHAGALRPTATTLRESNAS